MANRIDIVRIKQKLAELANTALARDKFSKDNLKAMQNKALFNLLLWSKVPRGFGKCRIVTRKDYKKKYSHDKTSDFLVISKKNRMRFVFNTGSIIELGKRVHRVPKKLRSTLYDFVCWLSKVLSSNEFLFLNTSLQPLNATEVQIILRAITRDHYGCHLGLKEIRDAWKNKKFSLNPSFDFLQ